MAKRRTHASGFGWFRIPNLRKPEFRALQAMCSATDAVQRDVVSVGIRLAAQAHQDGRFIPMLEEFRRCRSPIRLPYGDPRILEILKEVTRTGTLCLNSLERARAMVSEWEG